MVKDLLQVVERAYASTETLAEWQRNVLAAASVLDRGPGLLACRTDWDAAAGRIVHSEIASTVAPEATQAFLRVGERVTVQHHGFILKSAGRTTSMVIRAPDISGRYEKEVALLASHGVRDCLGIVGPLEDHAFVALFVILPEVQALDARWVRRYRLLGIHLAAARRAVGANAEAWIAPNGKLLDAAPVARRASDALSLRVRAIEAARRPSKRAAVDEALDAWEGLVDGRWSLVEQFDRDGRRYFVAKRNPPGFSRLLRLSDAEARVAKLTALGQSRKLVGYTLGLSPSTVSVHLASAMLKLGVGRQADLARFAALFPSTCRAVANAPSA